MQTRNAFLAALLGVTVLGLLSQSCAMGSAEPGLDGKEQASGPMGGEGGGVGAAESAPADAPEAPAYEAADEDRDDSVVYRKRVVIDFGNDTIEGDLVQPEGEYLQPRSKLRHDSPDLAGRAEEQAFLGTRPLTTARPPAPRAPGKNEAALSTDARAGKIKKAKQHRLGNRGPQQFSSQQRQAIAEMARADEELWVVAREPSDTPRDQVAGPGSGELRTQLEGTDEMVPLPLKHTAVDARIAGYIASVQVKQQYHNPYAEKIEAVYVFPLPQDAAVSEFLMTIGDRTIRGIIREREEAERIYREARAQGHVASLLTQERPNIFTQKVANIEPGKAVDVDLTYYNTLPYRDGAYTFSFPMVVGPRFNPPGQTDGVGAVARGARGSSGQATEVSYLRPGERSGHDLSLTVDLEAGVKLEKVQSSTHAVDIESLSATRRRIVLQKKAVIPNQDFVLRYWVAGDQIKTAFLNHEDERGGFFTLVLTPPQGLKQIPRMDREMIFVLDCSGSMSGVPLEKARRAVRKVLELLEPPDTFQIIRFSNNASQLGREPVLATRKNVERGLRYLEGLNGTGGTMMIEGIKAALDFPHVEGKQRIVSFMTDGYIGNEAQILAAIHERLGAARLFSFGVGSSTNRYLLERMALMGRGAVAYVELNDDASDEAVDAFYERVAYPALSDIELDWGTMNVEQVFPSQVADLHVGRPVVVAGRYTGRLPSSVKVKGRVGRKTVRFEVPIEEHGEAQRPALAQIWARMRIADLANRATYVDDVAELVEEIKQTALGYSLMSKWTAFVAVDSSRVTEGDHGVSVDQPVPVPEGVRYDTTVQDPAEQ